MKRALAETVDVLVSSMSAFPDDVSVFSSGTRLQRIIDSGPGLYVIAKTSCFDVHIVGSDGLHEHASFDKDRFVKENAGQILYELVEGYLVGEYPGHIETDPPYEQLQKASAEIARRLGPKWDGVASALCSVMDERERFSRATGSSLRGTLGRAVRSAFRHAPDAEKLLTEEEWLEVVIDAARTAYRQAVVDAVDET